MVEGKEQPAAPRLSWTLQLLVGLTAGAAAALLVAFLGAWGIRMGLGTGIALAAVAWGFAFFALSKGWNGLIVGLLAGGLAGYIALKYLLR